MNESLFEKLVEISWRRRLTAAEERELQSWLVQHPDAAERWEAEAGLNQALERLEPVVPSSNFTRRVLELVELEQRAAERDGRKERNGSWIDRVWRALMLSRPKLAWGLALFVVAGGLAYHQINEHSLEQVASGVQSFSTLVAATAPEAVEDFEAVREFSQVRPETDQTDEALFALLVGE